MTDKREFEAIFRRYYGSMYRLACRMLGSEAEGKDAVSDVFAQLLDRQVSLHADTLQSFLLTSVRNHCINLLARRQREQQHATAVVAELNATQTATDNELTDLLHDYIERQLPPLSQQVLRLRYQQELKYREIAEALSVSEVTVYNHLSQSLKLIKEHFKSLGYDI